jgi:SAM-dependent methyltransferase
VTLSESWDEQAEAWAQYARTPGHDDGHERINLPAFLDLLPPPGRAALDVGCGEGRVGAELVRRGYRVVGVDSSPKMVELASHQHEARVADAAALPFDDGAFDLVYMYMSLMNLDDIPAGVREAARVLEPGGRFCVAVAHPTQTAGSWDRERDVFEIGDSYFDGPTKVWRSERDGIEMTFYDRPVSLDTYGRAFESAGLLVETIREPRPAEPETNPRAARVPLFLHFRAVKPR